MRPHARGVIKQIASLWKIFASLTLYDTNEEEISEFSEQKLICFVENSSKMQIVQMQILNLCIKDNEH